MARACKRTCSLAAHVYLDVKKDILACELRPDQEIYEGQLAERYGVSKTHS